MPQPNKTAPQHAPPQPAPHAPSNGNESMLSFVPEGMPRSIAEYLSALIPGSVLLFAFFIAAQLMVIMLGDLLAASYFLAACVMPVLAGVVSTLVLEKLRKKPLTLQRGAMVGAAASIAGAGISAVALLAISFVAKKPIFGSFISGFLPYVALAAIVAVDAVLGALGGALVVKFLKDQ